jgi:formate-dependent nitrite reductase cytochrome c552 subunit
MASKASRDNYLIAEACVREMARISQLLGAKSAQRDAEATAKEAAVAEVARLRQEVLEARMRADLAEAREAEAIRALEKAEKVLRRSLPRE